MHFDEFPGHLRGKVSLFLVIPFWLKWESLASVFLLLLFHPSHTAVVVIFMIAYISLQGALSKRKGTAYVVLATADFTTVLWLCFLPEPPHGEA